MERKFRLDMEAREMARAEELGPDREPPTPRPAAGVILARDGSAGPEVLLVRRRSDVGFAAGAHVFPGGTLDEEDADPAWVDWLAEPAAEAVAGTAEPGGPAARTFVVAALRETFEETGLLLSVEEPPGQDELATDRADLVAGRRRFVDIVAERGLRLAGDRLVLCARWITPEEISRRYDARFFLAQAATDAQVSPDTSELVDHLWIGPGDAVDSYFDGAIEMLFPTIMTLGWLQKGARVADWFEHFRASDVVPIMPRLRRIEGELRSLLPGEPGYDDRESGG